MDLDRKHGGSSTVSQVVFLHEKIMRYLANIITTTGILIGIIWCILVFRSPNILIAEWLLIAALVTDILDGKVARKYGSTKAGEYLDDIADFINFWIHPALWIWHVTGRMELGIFFACCVLFRLTRFTMSKQNTKTYFSGLPSPAGAIGLFWLLLMGIDEKIFLFTGILFLGFLMVSEVPHFHPGKVRVNTITTLAVIAGICLLPWVYGGTFSAVWLAQIVLLICYIFTSIIKLLIPHYVTR